MTNKVSVEETLEGVLNLCRNYESAPDWALGLKLAEECGEVSEAILYANGFIQHKELKEDVLHEVADVINVALGILTQHYPDVAVPELLTQLDAAMKTKNKKYAKILGANSK